MALDWKPLVKTIAPWIGTALGGPLGGMAVTAIGAAIGLDAPTEDKLKAALAGMTPEQMVALKNADNAFAEAMQAAGFEHLEKLEGLAVTDRESARDREAKVGDKTARNLAYLVMLGGVAVIACTLGGFTKVDGVLAGTLIGYTVAEMRQVLGYYFGSSAGSDKKTDILAQQTQGADDGRAA